MGLSSNSRSQTERDSQGLLRGDVIAVAAFISLAGIFLLPLSAHALQGGPTETVPKGYALVGVGYGSDDRGCFIWLREAQLTSTGLKDLGWRVKGCWSGGGNDNPTAAFVPPNNYVTGWSWSAGTSGGCGWQGNSCGASNPGNECTFQAYRKIDPATRKLTGPVFGWGTPQNGNCDERGYSGSTLKATFYVSDIPDSASCINPTGQIQPGVPTFRQCAAPTVSFGAVGDTDKVITAIKFELAQDGNVRQPVPVTYNLYSGPSGGTIEIRSKNSKTGDPVVSEWQFVSFPSTNPCLTVSDCKESSKIYSNQPEGAYTAWTMDQSAGPLYALKGVETKIAVATRRSSLFADFFSGIGEVFLGIARASWISQCSDPASTPPILSSLCSVWLPDGGWQIVDIEWDPVARVEASSYSLDFGDVPFGTSPSSQSLSLRNIGAPGSSIDWAASANQPWIVILDGSGTGLVVGDSDVMNVALDSARLAPGTNSGAISVDWHWTDSSGVRYPSTLSIPVTVNMTGGAPVSCAFDSDPSVVVPPRQSTLSWTCENAESCTISPGIGTVNPSSGNVQVRPTSTKIYTLACIGIGGGTNTTQLPVEVAVATSTIIEVPP